LNDKKVINIMRKQIVAGNWKMNNDLDASKSLVKKIAKGIKKEELKNTRVIVAPTFVNLAKVVKKAKKTKVEVAAQNMHFEKNGAFTGEISAEMLKSVGVEIVILGHSERREYFGETDALLAKKVDTALANKMEVIFCFGEVLEDRKSEKHFAVVESQIKNGLFHLEASAWKNIILAYEPVWAIGTGETASPEQAQEMHAFIRKIVADKYNAEVAENVSILYGGSVKPANAKEIFSKKDVDGGLIGGAALNSGDFISLVKSF
jgi:triosephosphate isomerase